MKWFLNTNKIKTGGFTALEMIVVVGIMALVATLILANISSFGDRLSVDRAAEEIASSVRQAQAFGLGVKESGVGSGIFPGYGLYFQNTANNSYILFADKNNNLQYSADEKVSEFFLSNNVQIFNLCANQKQTPVGPCGLADLTAIYLRPQPQVSLKAAGSSYSDIEVKIRGARGTIKTIVIWLSGQVTIE